MEALVDIFLENKVVVQIVSEEPSSKGRPINHFGQMSVDTSSRFRTRDPFLTLPLQVRPVLLSSTKDAAIWFSSMRSLNHKGRPLLQEG